MENVLKFKGEWRSYQKRILDNLSLHLADTKLHVVAAPGAGKTTLGIEIIARLNAPTLILAPTITIKNQWKARIIDAFLNCEPDEIISADIKNPKFITVATYQALLAAFSGDEEPQEDDLEEEETKENILCSRFDKVKADKIIRKLKSAKIKILCFDEAHHLRKEWWKALNYLVENLNPRQTLSLTATPPYDVDNAEWERYENLCGEIDEIISIPELVKNGDLCPHQDFIHFSRLKSAESELLKKHLERVKTFMNSVRGDEELIKGLLNSDCMRKAEDFAEKILDNPEFYVSVASFLKYTGQTVPQDFLKLFDAKQEELPAFTSAQAKNFLSGILVRNSKDFPELSKKLEEITAKAKNAGVLSQKTIYLADSPKIRRQMAGSLGKLDSIVTIVKTEYAAMRENLRMVILADYIRLDDKENLKLGVIPIWRTLKSEFGNSVSIGVLTGQIILIPKNVKDSFESLLKVRGLDVNAVSITDYDDEFIKITPKENIKSEIVNLITRFFNEGNLTVLVGTQALLGEGWDAPSINSLILSSTVSSFMLSNQMRGRAIRKDKNNPDKVANIWHLASVKVLSEIEALKESILPQATRSEDDMCVNDYFDWQKLIDRFEGYEAPTLTAPFVIESGIKRIYSNAFKESKANQRDFAALNNFMINNASHRDLTRQHWQECLYEPYNAPAKKLKTGVETSWQPKGFIYNGGLLGYSAIAVTGLYMATLFVKASALLIALIIVLVTAAWMVKPCIKAIRCSTPDGIIRQIGVVILETLASQGFIKTSLKLVKISCKNDKNSGFVYFAADNLTPEENKMLISSLREFLDPIVNPRYLLVRKNKLFGFLMQTDYHSIPAIISKNKESVEIFKGLWKKYIGDAEIIYTRTPEGRKILLKARKDAFSALVRPKSQKISRWQ